MNGHILLNGNMRPEFNFHLGVTDYAEPKSNPHPPTLLLTRQRVHEEPPAQARRLRRKPAAIPCHYDM